MAQASNDEGYELITLNDSSLTLEDLAQDIRGLDAFDTSGDQIGTVEELYADEGEWRVRFLDVGAEGFLGLGKKHFLIPIEAMNDVSEEGVDQSREKVVGPPAYDPGIVPLPRPDSTCITTMATLGSPGPNVRPRGRLLGPDAAVPRKAGWDKKFGENLCCYPTTRDALKAVDLLER
jgi:PRC-barrel domain